MTKIAIVILASEASIQDLETVGRLRIVIQGEDPEVWPSKGFRISGLGFGV